MPSIRLATASPSTQPTLSATISLLNTLAHRAASKSIDLLLLPEAFLGGYPRGKAFGSVVGERKPEGRAEFAAYFDRAVDLGDTVGHGAGAGSKWLRRELGGDGGDGDDMQRGDGTREELEKIAAETGVFLITGVIEKSGGSLYCAIIYICPEKGIIGKRRKVMPTGAERLIWAQGCPSTLKAVSTTIRNVRINLAAAICWESYMPLLRQSLYSQNINLYLAPTADGRDTWLGLMRTIGVEGRCFVVSSNMATRVDKGDSNGISLSSTAAAAAARATTATGSSGTSPVMPPIRAFAPHPMPRIPSPHRKRRKSVFDEDGNEIVLCCPANDPPGNNFTTNKEKVGDDDSAPLTNGIGPNTVELPLRSDRRNSVPCEEPGMDIALPRLSPTRSKRRKSIIDEDGNEIVLCGMKEDDDESNERTETSKAVAGEESTKNASEAGAASSWLSRGGSCIVGPFGDVLVGPQWEDDEGIIWADVDFRDCIKGRLDLDAAGSYSRNDSFKLSVNGLDLNPLPY